MPRHLTLHGCLARAPIGRGAGPVRVPAVYLAGNGPGGMLMHSGGGRSRCGLRRSGRHNAAGLGRPASHAPRAAHDRCWRHRGPPRGGMDTGVCRLPADRRWCWWCESVELSPKLHVDSMLLGTGSTERPHFCTNKKKILCQRCLLGLLCFVCFVLCLFCFRVQCRTADIVLAGSHNTSCSRTGDGHQRVCHNASLPP